MNAEPRILRTQAEETLALEFAAARTRLPGSPAVAAARETAFATFQKAGLPHRRTEPWRYTDLRALLRTVPPLVQERAEIGALADPLAGLDRARLVVVDGAFRPELSDLSGLDGLSVRPLAELLREGDGRVGGQVATLDDAMVSLNSALMTGGVVIDIPAGAKIERAVEIAHVTSGLLATHTRNLVVIGADASARILETHVGPADSAYQANIVTEATVGDRAKVIWAKLQMEGGAAVHLGTFAASIGTETEFDHLTLMTGASI
jgi:Fe-S cluster assembly protein SufD